MRYRVSYRWRGVSAWEHFHLVAHGQVDAETKAFEWLFEQYLPDRLINVAPVRMS